MWDGVMNFGTFEEAVATLQLKIWDLWDLCLVHEEERERESEGIANTLCYLKKNKLIAIL